jgi:hypothetical protein
MFTLNLPGSPGVDEPALHSLTTAFAGDMLPQKSLGWVAQTPCTLLAKSFQN